MDADAGLAASRRSAPPARRAVISPLLANIYLDPLDKLMAARGYRMVRYADDPGSRRRANLAGAGPGSRRRANLAGAGSVILCRTREDADAALAEVRTWVEANGLTLHPEKTHVGDCRQPGQGFAFVMRMHAGHDGYRFEAGRRFVRKKSLDKLKDSIRAKTGRNRGDSLAVIVGDLNRGLRGWFGYFKHAHPYTFAAIDGMIRRRLRSLLMKQNKQKRFGISPALSKRWPNAFFADAGLFALHAAWQSARQSR